MGLIFLTPTFSSTLLLLDHLFSKTYILSKRSLGGGGGGGGGALEKKPEQHAR